VKALKGRVIISLAPSISLALAHVAAAAIRAAAIYAATKEHLAPPLILFFFLQAFRRKNPST
jgi:hypothetical protein